MDQHKLRSHVFDKTGIKIDVDDPIFALVALNEAVLAETVGRQLALLDAATQALAAQARAAGGLPAAPAPAVVKSHHAHPGTHPRHASSHAASSSDTHHAVSARGDGVRPDVPGAAAARRRRPPACVR